MAWWLEKKLVHGEGDLAGEPFRLAPHLLRILFRWFEYEPETGLYLHHKGLVGWPKGSVKTEFEAALSLEHLEGPSRVRGTPLVKVAAVDGDQAEEIIRVAGMMLPEQSELVERLKVDRAAIRQRDGHGAILATSASGAKLDGARPSLQLNDELWGWDEHGLAGARRYDTLNQNTFKRANARELNVSTAGRDLDTLLGAMYQLGCAVARGEAVQPGVLFEWWEASEHWDLDDPEQLRQAILESNPMATVVPNWVDKLTIAYSEMKLRGSLGEYIRRNLNRFDNRAEDDFLDLDIWDARATNRALREGADVVLGFDGSLNNDTTAVIGATVSPNPHLFVVGHWARGDNDRDWSVPVIEVERTIESACAYFRVRELAADFAKWVSSLKRLEDRGVNVVEFPQSDKRMGPACQGLQEGVYRDQLTHDGDRRLRTHMKAARAVDTDWGVRIKKRPSGPGPFVDLAQAAVMAHNRALWWHFEGRVGASSMPLVGWA